MPLEGGAVVPVVLPAGGVQCNGAGGDLQFGTPPCPNSTGVSQLATGSNNIQGVKLYTGGAVSYLPSADPSILSISTDGLLNGTINSGTVIPLSYDFSLAQSSGTVTGWTLDYILADSRLGGECRRVIWTLGDPDHESDREWNARCDCSGEFFRFQCDRSAGTR